MADESYVLRGTHVMERPQVDTDAPTCRLCGSLMMRTGTCHTCLDCGETAGCG